MRKNYDRGKMIGEKNRVNFERKKIGGKICEGKNERENNEEKQWGDKMSEVLDTFHRESFNR